MRGFGSVMSVIAMCAGLIAAVAVNAGPADAAAGHDPIGHVDSYKYTPDGRTVATGWAADPDLGPTAGLTVRVYVDGSYVAATSTQLSRPDVARAHPGYGTATGFKVEVPMSKGVHQLCIYAINRGAGYNSALICGAYGQKYHAYLQGRIESITVDATSPQKVTFTGWALDPTDRSGTTFAVAILPGDVFDNTSPPVQVVTPTLPRPDVARVYPGRNPDSGFRTTWTQAGEGFTAGQPICLFVYYYYSVFGPVVWSQAPVCTTFP